MNQTVIVYSVPSTSDLTLFLQNNQTVRTVQTETEEIDTADKFTQLPEIQKEAAPGKGSSIQPESLPMFMSFLRRASSLVESALNENTLVKLKEVEGATTSDENIPSKGLVSRSLVLKWSELTNGRTITGFISLTRYLLLFLSVLNTRYLLFTIRPKISCGLVLFSYTCANR